MSREDIGILGVLGGGQLAKMLGLEAYRLGLKFAVIENQIDSPAGMMTKLDYSEGWENREELDRFINMASYITLENEFIDPDILAYIEKFKPVFPSSATMKLVRDKFVQKKTFAKSGIPVTQFAKISNASEAKEFGQRYGYPFLIKSREMGYDGYGNFTVKDEAHIEDALSYFKANKAGIELMGEAFVPFKKELAVMAVRSITDEEAVYPCVETVQKNHICHIVHAPAEVSLEIQQEAQKLALDCVKSVNGVGVFGVEFFLTDAGELLVNEIAPRPHNSGHYTIEGCHTSQFENAIRAISGMPLGSTDMRDGYATMVNILGDSDGASLPSGVEKSLTHTKAKIHLYGKSKAREGRKMGHVTSTAENREESVFSATNASKSLTWKD